MAEAKAAAAAAAAAAKRLEDLAAAADDDDDDDDDEESSDDDDEEGDGGGSSSDGDDAEEKTGAAVDQAIEEDGAGDDDDDDEEEEEEDASDGSGDDGSEDSGDEEVAAPAAAVPAAKAVAAESSDDDDDDDDSDSDDDDDDSDDDDDGDDDDDSDSDEEELSLSVVDLDVPFSAAAMFAVRDSTGEVRAFRVADGAETEGGDDDESDDDGSNAEAAKMSSKGEHEPKTKSDANMDKFMKRASNPVKLGVGGILKTCKDCQGQFEFSQEEQDFFKKKGFDMATMVRATTRSPYPFRFVLLCFVLFFLGGVSTKDTLMAVRRPRLYERGKGSLSSHSPLTELVTSLPLPTCALTCAVLMTSSHILIKGTVRSLQEKEKGGEGRRQQRWWARRVWRQGCR